MSKVQRIKGHNWERAVARQLREIFGEARRCRQDFNEHGNADVIEASGRFAIECKVGAKPNLRAALKQAELVDGDRWPLAICKDDRQRPIALMYWDDMQALLDEWYHNEKYIAAIDGREMFE